MLYRDWFQSFLDALTLFMSMEEDLFSLFDVQIDTKGNGKEPVKQKYAFAKPGVDATVDPSGKEPNGDILEDPFEYISDKQMMDLYDAAKENRLFIKLGSGLGIPDANKQMVNVDDSNQCVIEVPEKEIPVEEPVEEDIVYDEEPKTEMERLARIINKEPRPEKALKVPERLKTGGTLEDLESFKKDTEELSADDIAYLDSRIATEKFFSDFFSNRKTNAAEPIKAVTRDDGTIILDHIHQDRFQTTGMGCYSCAYKLLLQSRGVNLTQQQIRAYKGDRSDFIANDRSLGDNMGNIVSLGGIVTAGIPNTAVKELTFKNLPAASEEERSAIHDVMQITLMESLQKYSSPVALLIGGHYTTIVGYNPKTDTITFKNSWGRKVPPVKGLDPDKSDTLTLSELLDKERLTFTYLVDINPENPSEGMNDMDGLEFVKGPGMEHGEFMKGDGKAMGYLDCKLPNSEGISVSDKYFPIAGKNAYIQTSYMLPKQLDLTPQQEQVISENFSVRKLSEAPEKQALMNEIKARKEQLSHETLRVTQRMAAIADAQIRLRKATQSQVASIESEISSLKQNLTPEEKTTLDAIYMYFYCSRLEANIDALTPVQVREAFSEYTISSRFDNISRESDLCSTLAYCNNQTVSMQQFEEIKGGYFDWDDTRPLWESMADKGKSLLEQKEEFVAKMKRTGPGSTHDAIMLDEINKYLIKKNLLPSDYVQPEGVRQAPVKQEAAQTSVQSVQQADQPAPVKQEELAQETFSEEKRAFVGEIGRIVSKLEKIGDVSSTEGKAYKNAYDGIREVYQTLLKTDNDDFTPEYKLYALRAINSLKRGYESTHTSPDKASNTQRKILTLFGQFDSLAKDIRKQISSAKETAAKEAAAKEAAAEEMTFPNPSDVLGQPKNQENLTAITNAPDFIYSKKIPTNIIQQCPVEALKDFEEKHGEELNDKEKAYLSGRIASEQLYEDLRRNPAQPVMKDPVTDEGIILLEHIHQTEFQSTNNGCYSVAMSLLLQSRGLNLNQKQVRAFRGDSDTQSERFLGDEMGNVGSLGGIASTGLINTGMVERTYPLNLKNALKPDETNTDGKNPDWKKQEVLADIKKNILTALLVHKSPVALLMDGHYVTVVGYDVTKDKLLVKNSLPGPHNVDKNHEMSLNSLASARKLSLSYLLDIKPDKPLDAIDGIRHKQALEMIDDGISFSEVGNLGKPDLQYGKAWKTFGDADDISSTGLKVTVEVRVPEKLQIPTKMKASSQEESQKKQLLEKSKKELLKKIEQEQNKLFPEGTEIIPNSTNVQFEKYDYSNVELDCFRKTEDGRTEKLARTVEDFKTYYYLSELKEKINELTPKQTELAMESDWAKESATMMSKSSNFKTFMMGGYKNPIPADFAASWIMAQNIVNKNLSRWKKMSKEEMISYSKDYFKGKTEDDMTNMDRIVYKEIQKQLAKFEPKKKTVDSSHKEETKKAESPVVSHA